MDTQTAEQSNASTPDEERQINVALLVDNDYLFRFRSIFSHMLVGLVDQPINVTLVCPDPIAAVTLPIGPAKIIEFNIPFWPWKYREALQSLAGELRSAKVNLIHSCSGRSCWLAVDLARILNIPYVITFNGLFQEDCYLRVDKEYCGRLIGISEPICTTLREIYGSQMDKIELVRPGCFIRPQSPRNGGPRVITSVGSFERNNGYDVLLKAVAEVQNRGLECLVFLFGRGPMEHSLHHWVNQHGLGKTVNFLEVLPNWDEILKEVDFYIQPGPFYSLHSGPYEAMAHGCPVICTQDTAMDLVVNGQNGMLFKSGDVSGLADILERWLTDKIDWSAFSDQALTYARSELSLSKTTEKLSRCYQSVLSEANI